MKRLLLALLCSTAAFAQGGNGYVSVPISLSAFTLNPGGNYLVTLPDGTQAIDIMSGFSVDLGVAPAQLQGWPNPTDGFYTLSFDVQNFYPNYPGYYYLEIDFGIQELCSTDGWGLAPVLHVTAICGSPRYIVIDQALPGGGPVQGQNHLILNGSVSGWHMYFKNFSVKFTPVN